MIYITRFGRHNLNTNEFIYNKMYDDENICIYKHVSTAKFIEVD